ncbi:MAG: hypothetical protein WBQ34_02260 [Candidatus Acidiferrales bacterium]
MDFKGNQQQSSYAVEVSGWDANEAFFLENTVLTWTADGIKEIIVHHPVREGSLLFVRLMLPVANTDSCPIACQAVKVIEHAAGRVAIQLAQLRPRAFFKDTVRDLNYSKAKVA